VLSTLGQRGIPITLEFEQGHGLKPGDALRYRGINVGAVQNVTLAGDLDRIQVTVLLSRDAEHLAREGSRFWIVRPQFNLASVTGLDTLVGANYLNVLPGPGERRRRFVGMEEPPPPEVLEPGGLEILLRTPDRGGLRPGAPLNYRQVVIGTIVNVDLSKDVSAVEASIYIKPRYVPLIRENTKFWKTGGAHFSAGLTGLSVDVDSVRSLLLGGVTLGIPPEPGKPVTHGHEFTLHDEPERAWLEWIPSMALYDAAFLHERPKLLRATLKWRQKNLLYMTRDKERSGWLLPVAEGLLGPKNVLTPPDKALPGSVAFTLGGISTAPPNAIQPYGEGLAILSHTRDLSPWTHRRRFVGPEATLIVADPDNPARYVGANGYRLEDSKWTIDSPAPFDDQWHGACVLAEKDGALLGILLVDGNQVEVVWLNDYLGV
jgi:hypothetical protein